MKNARWARVLLTCTLVLVTLASGVALTSRPAPEKLWASTMTMAGVITVNLPAEAEQIRLTVEGTELLAPVVEYTPTTTEATLAYLAAGTYKVHFSSPRTGRAYVELKIGDPSDPGLDLERCASKEYDTRHCAAELLPDMVRDLGVRATRDAVLAMSEEHPAFGNECVPYTYGYAELVAQEMGAAEAMRADLMLCRFAYIHGAVAAAALRGMPAQQVADLCLTPNKFLDVFPATVQCGHGVGHGAYIANRGNVAEALKWCDLVTAKYDADQNCVEGVYMMMMNASSDSRHKTVVDPLITRRLILNALPSSCSALPEKIQSGCYRYTVRALTQDARGDGASQQEEIRLLEDVKRICPQNEPGNGCWFGLGEGLFWALSETGGGDPIIPVSLHPTVLSLCTGSEPSEYCLLRVVTLTILPSGDVRVAEPLCSFYRTHGLASVCEGEALASWIKMISSTIKTDPSSSSFQNGPHHSG